MSEIQAEAPQATASEGLAQGSYVAARAGFEPTTVRTKCDESTIEPPRPTYICMCIYKHRRLSMCLLNAHVGLYSIQYTCIFTCVSRRTGLLWDLNNSVSLSSQFESMFVFPTFGCVYILMPRPRYAWACVCSCLVRSFIVCVCMCVCVCVCLRVSLCLIVRRVSSEASVIGRHTSSYC